ncbi:MAG: hypothetical protein JW774_09520 [Candidatus Aureabacteria bacterium]|nr:hypothetical protein [Candidatus Auribacterota bacterium]
MPVSIRENGQPFEAEFHLKGERIPLPDFVRQLNAEVNKYGRIITRFQLNGLDYDLNSLDTDTWVVCNDSIEFESASPVEVAKKSVQEILNQLPTLEQDVEQILNELVKGNRELAFRLFSSFLNEFRGIIQIFQTIEAIFSLDYSRIQGSEKTLHDLNDHLVKVLTEMKTAMGNEDMVSLSDLMEYEIKPIITGDLKKALVAFSTLLQDERF